MRRLLLVVALAASAGCATGGGAPGGAATVDIDVFHRALGPYGQWMSYGPYGECWRPARVGAGWTPFSIGTWVWSDDGWLWMSADPFGPLPFHYGGWVLDPVYGWLWVPGFEWAPAWVVWRVGPDFVGWSPLPPRTRFRIAVAAPDPERWVFVPAPRFAAGPVHRVAVPRDEVPRIFRRTEPAPPARSGGPGAAPWGGPGRAQIERARGAPVPTRRLVPAPAPRSAGRDLGDAVEVYRPSARASPPVDDRDASSERPVAPAPGPGSSPARPAPAPGGASPVRPPPPSRDARERAEPSDERPASGREGDRERPRPAPAPVER